MRRLLSTLGTAALLAGAGLVGAAPAHAAGCTGSSGVTVVVDYGGSTDVRCASGNPGTAGAALTSAGFSVDQVQRQPGAICRINSAPDVACETTRARGSIPMSAPAFSLPTTTSAAPSTIPDELPA